MQKIAGVLELLSDFQLEPEPILEPELISRVFQHCKRHCKNILVCIIGENLF